MIHLKSRVIKQGQTAIDGDTDRQAVATDGQTDEQTVGHTDTVNFRNSLTLQN